MPIRTGSCHCGAVEFEVEVENDFVGVSHCDCSYCRRKSAYIATARLDQLRVTKGAEYLSLYQWGTKTAKHYFCKVCGIYTHHQRRSNPNEFGFNIACIEGVNPFDYGPVKIHDGVNHPSDK